MSYRHKTPEEYAEMYAQTYGVTVEEAKQTAVYKEFEKYSKERDESVGNEGH